MATNAEQNLLLDATGDDILLDPTGEFLLLQPGNAIGSSTSPVDTPVHSTVMPPTAYHPVVMGS